MGFLIQEDSNPIFGLKLIDLLLDASATTISFRDASGAILQSHPANTLEAVANGLEVRIQLKGGIEVVMDSVPPSGITINSIAVSLVLATAVNSVNEVFANIGSAGNAPIIISPLVINSVLGTNINYNVVADASAPFVAINWDFSSLPSGHDITPINSANHTGIIGSTNTSIFPIGTYNLSFTAINYYGSTTINLTLNKTSAFTNSFSFEGSSSTYFDATGATITQKNTCPMYMPASTSVGTAWTLWFWYKHDSSDPGGDRDIFSFGDMGSGYGYTNRGMHVAAGMYSGGTGVRMYYGNTEYGQSVKRYMPQVSKDTWHSVMVIYNGGDTADGTGNAFVFAMDGVVVTASTVIQGSGASAGVYCQSGSGNDYLRIGSAAARTSDYLKISEMAIFNSDRVSDLTTFHNGGSGAFDFTSYNPSQWYRFGDDGDVAAHPDMTNHGSLANLDMEMISGTVANYVSDVPT